MELEKNPNDSKAHRKYTSESRHSFKVKAIDEKTSIKKLDSFTKNFINQGNFIQKQFMYGQIRRLKTEIERNSVEQA